VFWEVIIKIPELLYPYLKKFSSNPIDNDGAAKFLTGILKIFDIECDKKIDFQIYVGKHVSDYAVYKT